MFLKERQRLIHEAVEDEGRVAVTDLATRFGVSEDCIRKDLRQLEAEGVLERVYGGAVRVEREVDRFITHRIGTRAAEKHEIAEKAYALIEDDETVFLDASSTVLALARLVSAGGKHVHVVTNMIDIAQVTATNPIVETVVIGGTMDLETNGFNGAGALFALEPLHFDRAFIGASCANVETGAVSTYDADDGLVKRQVVRSSRASYLLVGSEKLGGQGNFRFAMLGDFEAVITDAGVAAYGDDPLASRTALL